MPPFTFQSGALASGNPSNFGQSAAFSFIGTFPAGILEVAAGLLVQLDSDDADLGTVFSIIFLGKAAIGSIFTAVFVAILQNKLPVELNSRVTPAALSAGLPKSSIEALLTAIASGEPSAIAQVPGISPAIEQAALAVVPTAYAAAYAYVYYAAVAVGLVGVIGKSEAVSDLMSTGQRECANCVWESMHLHQRLRSVLHQPRTTTAL